MSIVVDASIVIAWASPDEANPLADRAMAHGTEHGGVVPSLWLLEVSNTLLVLERKGRLTASEVGEILADFSELSLFIEQSDPSTVREDTLELARTHRLTAYDAVYLELAVRLRLPLATLDRELRNAAEATKTPLYPLSGGESPR